MTNSLYESIINCQGNANQVYNEILTPARVTSIKQTNKLQNKQTSKKIKPRDESVGKDKEKSEHLYIVGGNIKCCSRYGK